jgi:hypothetical protein
MKLRHLEIHLQPSYAESAGKYIASIQYEDQYKNEVKLVLDPVISAQLLGFCGPAITAAASRAAREIEQNIIGSLEEMKQLPEIPV